jgi:hypothetical protein
VYFRLQQLQKATFSDYDKSITFLTGLAGSDYSDQVNTLITSVKNYNLDAPWPDVGESGLLPEHLRIPALATRLNQFAQRRISQSLVPYVNRLNFNDQYPSRYPITLFTLPQWYPGSTTTTTPTTPTVTVPTPTPTFPTVGVTTTRGAR